MNHMLRRNTVLVAIALTSFIVGATNAQQPDVDEIVRRAFERAEANEAKARQYTFHRREEQRSLDRAGLVKKLRREIVGEYCNYRKLSAESELIVADRSTVVAESASPA